MRTKEQGNVGIGKAISYFTEQLYTVSVPLNDSQKYDLVVEINTKLLKVQVKTTRQLDRHGTNYVVKIVATGGTRQKATQEYFDNTASDLVFIYCLNGDAYLIPSDKVLTKCKITLGKQFREYKI